MSRAVHPYVRLGVLAGLVVGAALAVRATPVGQYLASEGIVDAFVAARRSMWAPVLFVAVYAGWTALALPGVPVTLAGGAVFGFWLGAALNTIGANLGANAAFGLARALGRAGVQRLAGGRLSSVDRVSARHGFVGLLALRLVPLVPFNVLNVGAGLSAIRWRDYGLATLVGIVPGTLVYTFFADALVRGAPGAGEAARTRLWVAVGLLLALAAVSVVARRLVPGARREARSEAPRP